MGSWLVICKLDSKKLLLKSIEQEKIELKTAFFTNVEVGDKVKNIQSTELFIPTPAELSLYIKQASEELLMYLGTRIVMEV